jgi:hypothetical protein
MNPRTEATLAKLDGIEWFYAVGNADTDAAIVLSSWDEAIDSCVSPQWEAMQLDASNRYRSRVLKVSVDRYRLWNNIAEELRPLTVDLVKRKTHGVISKFRLPKVFEDTVNWDILHLALEAEYADLVNPGFYAIQAYWYTKGHFPCGWRGSYPEGKLVIY